jgi:hypothetical protein
MRLSAKRCVEHRRRGQGDRQFNSKTNHRCCRPGFHPHLFRLVRDNQNLLKFRGEFQGDGGEVPGVGSYGFGAYFCGRGVGMVIMRGDHGLHGALLEQGLHGG